MCLIIPSACVAIPIGNNIILKNYTNNLKHITLNADYEILAVDSECGKLIGNGNGMQYFSALLIHSNENLEWENDEWEGEGVFLIKANDITSYDYIKFEFGEYCENIEKKLNEIDNTENYYVLYSFYNAPLESIWNDDLRAH